MSADYDHIWKRTLPEAHHVVLCDLYHLKTFLRASKGRRALYFRTVAEGPATLQRAFGYEPSERQVLSWLAWVLGQDRTFLAYVTTHGAVAEALDPQKWRLLLEAGAGAIVGEYLIAAENGKLA